MISDIITDQGYFSKNGFLVEKDYNTLNRKLKRSCEGIRVPMIRKGLNFLPLSYDDYVEGTRDVQNLSDPEDLMKYTSLVYEVEFLSSFFPDFEQEFFTRGAHITLNSGESESWMEIQPFMYSTLTTASHQIESEINTLYRDANPFKGQDAFLEATTTFSILPNYVATNTHNIRIHLALNIID